MPGLVISISGFGFAFTDDKKQTLLRRTVRFFYEKLIQLVFSHPNIRIIVQNSDDYLEVSKKKKIPRENIFLIRGSGVDLEEFRGFEPKNKNNLVILPARMLEDKGVEDFVEAAAHVKMKAPSWRLLLVGAAGYDNPSAITQTQLQSWQAV